MSLKSLSFSLLVVSLKDADLSSLVKELHKKREMAPDFFKFSPIVIHIDNKKSGVDLDLHQIRQSVIDENFILAGISGDLSLEQKYRLMDFIYNFHHHQLII
jgi:septum site-determining protein MinC